MSTSENSESAENLTSQEVQAATPADAPLRELQPVGPRPIENQTSAFGLVGMTPAIREVQGFIARYGPTHCSVLVTGETGTGKEVTAKGLHKASQRREKNWVAFNCAAVSDEMMASSLFGHRRGSFTGAVNENLGAFGQAQGSTLFFDEIGDMSLSMQAMVLRAFQDDGEVQVVGGTTRKVNVRLIFGTNKDLGALVASGRFREDLYYRINGLTIHIPPLRERYEDIPLLASLFVSRFAAQFGKSSMKITTEGKEKLRRHNWPGNVRELENVMRRAVLLSDETIKDTDISIAQRNVDGREIPNTLAFPTLLESERKYFQDLLAVTGGNMSRAAVIAGIGRSHLYSRLKKYSLEGLRRSLRFEEE